MRLLLSMIGYLCVATVLSTSLGLGYLWQSQRLTDEKVFRIVALVHGVDVDGSQSEGSMNGLIQEETPPEEPSLVEEERVMQIALRNDEARRNALDRGRKEFDHMFRQLVEARERIDGIASELEERIEEEAELTAQEGIADVVNNLKSIKPESAKNQLLKLLDSGGTDPIEKKKAMENVIRILETLPANARASILKKFVSETEQERLHEVMQEILKGGPKKGHLNEVLQQLQDRDFSN